MHYSVRHIKIKVKDNKVNVVAEAFRSKGGWKGTTRIGKSNRAFQHFTARHKETGRKQSRSTSSRVALK